MNSSQPSVHPVDAVLKRRFIESLQDRATRLREATHLARWDEARREIGVLRSGGQRYSLVGLESAGRVAEAAIPRETTVFPGLRKKSFFERDAAQDPSPQIETLLRAVDAVVADEIASADELPAAQRRIS